MKRLYSVSRYARLLERYCIQHFPERKEAIFSKAEQWYAVFEKQMPDLGGKDNPMAANMNDWFTILSFYEASDHAIGGEALLEMKEGEAERLRFLGRLIDGNRSQWIYRAFEKFYLRYEKNLRKHQESGVWMDSWKVEINPDQREEGVCFHLIGCPIAAHAKKYGYEELLPYLCKTDHMLAEVLHVRLIRTQTEALGGDYCDYWYVGDQSPVLKQYRNLKKI